MDQLKEVILSTLEEIQENIPSLEEEQKESLHVKPEKKTDPVVEVKEEQKTLTKENFFSEVTAKTSINGDESEVLFLNSLRERMLVLFEGFQAPNNTALEAKIDLTLNFLEYVLASIDTRLDQIKGK